MGVQCSEHTLLAESTRGVSCPTVAFDEQMCLQPSCGHIVLWIQSSHAPCYGIFFFSGRRVPNSEQTVHLTTAWSQ